MNPRKAAGPDSIPGVMIKEGADQLAGILTKLFNLFLIHVTVLTYVKASNIIPIPQKTAIDGFSYYRPIALTSVVMKCLEQLVSQHIRDCCPPSLDPHQFTYRANRSTEEAVAITLHKVLSHLENRQSYVRMLFVDILINKLLNLQMVCTLRMALKG